jgi:hypothetical protein
MDIYVQLTRAQPPNAPRPAAPGAVVAQTHNDNFFCNND